MSKKSKSGGGSKKKKVFKKNNPSGTKKHPLDVLKKSTKALGSKVKKAGGKIKNLSKKALHKSVEAAEFMALKPVEPLMIKMLKKKGVNVPKKSKMKLVASLFVTNIIGKGAGKLLNKVAGDLDFDVPNDYQHMEMLNYLNALEHVDSDPDNKAIAVDAAEDAAFKAASGVAGAIPGGTAATSIIHMILDYFKGVQRKKKAKEAKEKLKAEAEAKGETPEQAEKTAETAVNKDPELRLTPEEAKVVDPKAPLTDEEKETAVSVDKVHDDLAKVLPGTEDTDGTTHVKEPQHWWVGFWARLFPHHAKQETT